MPKQRKFTYFGKKWTYNEIAAAVGISRSTARMRVKRFGDDYARVFASRMGDIYHGPPEGPKIPKRPSYGSNPMVKMDVSERAWCGASFSTHGKTPKSRNACKSWNVEVAGGNFVWAARYCSKTGRKLEMKMFLYGHTVAAPRWEPSPGYIASEARKINEQWPEEEKKRRAGHLESLRAVGIRLFRDPANSSFGWQFTPLQE